jgi:DNA-binding LytR/AlgR family response regulator
MKKPFTYQRFLEAIQKVKAKESQAAEEGQQEEDYLFIKSEGKLVRLNNDDILYIESMGDYVKFVTAAKNMFLITL